MTSNLPKAPISRMFKKVGGERLSADARDLIMEDVEAYTENLMRDCISVSKHAGRKTVLSSDVRFVQKLIE